MKDCQKRWEPNRTDSVIARLMGFDELRGTLKPPHEKHRVLSESYVRCAASVGPQPSSLVATGRLRIAKNEIVHEVKGENDNLKKCVDSSCSMVKKGIRNSKHVLRYIQKYERDSLAGHRGDLGFDYRKKSLEFEPVMKDGPRIVSTSVSAIKPKSDLEVVKLDRHSRSEYRKHGKFYKPENGKDRLQIAYKDSAINGIVPCRHSCIACTRTMSRIFGQERPRSKFDELLKTAKVVQGVEVCVRGQNLDKMLALPDKNKSTLKEAIKEALSSGRQDESTEKDDYLKEQLVSRKDFLDPKGERGYEQFTGVNDTASPSSKNPESSGCYFKSSGEVYIRGVGEESDNGFKNDRCKEKELSQSNCTGTKSDPLLESVPAILSGESEHSSFVEEAFGEETFLNAYFEEESSFSNHSRVEFPEFQDNLKRTYQQSPDSVLEQFDMQISSTFKNFDSIGLQLQLQALNSDSEDNYSEGSVMLLSGDEDFDKWFEDLSSDGTIVKTWLRYNKIKNSSYMVDILDEAGFCGVNSFFMDFFKIWYSMECPISPSVFKALEKKYGKQTSWKKSERRLLFDLINLGLVSIFSQVINFQACPKSVRTRFYASLKRDEVEDELWRLLISQDKEISKNLSEKAFDKWNEAEEGITIVCEELETSLFDELMMELASLWG